MNALVQSTKPPILLARHALKSMGKGLYKLQTVVDTLVKENQERYSRKAFINLLLDWVPTESEVISFNGLVDSKYFYYTPKTQKQKSAEYIIKFEQPNFDNMGDI